MKFKTFFLGGIHPPDNKLSAGVAVETFDLPKVAVIPLSQHIGAPATPVVKKGDQVLVGTLLGKGEAFISANVHSSVSGKVKNILDMPMENGYSKKAVLITVQGDEWEESIDRSSELVEEIALDSKAIVDRIKEAGIVGMGGACFPAHVKFMLPPGKTADTLIINAVECEPYLTADHRIMLERADEILVGVQVMIKALALSKAFVGIEANKLDAIEHMSLRAEKLAPGVEIIPLKIQYPQGAEKQLINAVTGRQVPSGALPLDAGCVVNNVGTALAIYEAVQKNKPLFERVVTVTGKTLGTPSNFLVRTGTPLEALIEKAGGFPEGTGKVISGGPMMGKASARIDAPVTKGTSGVTLLQESEASRGVSQNCIRCSKCNFACPMGIEPYLLEKQSEKAMWEDAEKNNILDCIECGSCSYVCPSNRPILDFIRLGKGNAMRLRRERSAK